MNNKIFRLLIENLNLAFGLPKYDSLQIDAETRIDYLPWTPARFKKFKDKIENTLGVESELVGTVKQVVAELDRKYLHWFFGEVWRPRTEKYQYTGWPLVDMINKHNPGKVLDVGCGYNQFKERISNLIGIDPYNNQADYMVDILDFKIEPEIYDAIIALGSINFNSQADIEGRVQRCVELLASDGRMYFRANPGIEHKNGPWVDIFPWSFEKCYEIAKKFDLEVETFKVDQDRLFWIYQKA
jgi:SAM-dependent methyltransferase